MSPPAVGGEGDVRLNAGSAWVNDESKFGFRLLKQMGWEGAGTGLGKDAGGRVGPVVATVKRDNGGLGAERVLDSSWTGARQVVQGLEDTLKGAVAIGHAPVLKKKPTDVVDADGKGSYYERKSKQKKVSGYSKEDLKQIFSGVQVAPSSTAIGVAPQSGVAKKHKNAKRKKEKKSKS